MVTLGLFPAGHGLILTCCASGRGLSRPACHWPQSLCLAQGAGDVPKGSEVPAEAQSSGPLKPVLPSLGLCTASWEEGMCACLHPLCQDASAEHPGKPVVSRCHMERTQARDWIPKVPDQACPPWHLCPPFPSACCGRNWFWRRHDVLFLSFRDDVGTSRRRASCLWAAASAVARRGPGTAHRSCPAGTERPGESPATLHLPLLCRAGLGGPGSVLGWHRGGQCCLCGPMCGPKMTNNRVAGPGNGQKSVSLEGRNKLDSVHGGCKKGGAGLGSELSQAVDPAGPRLQGQEDTRGAAEGASFCHLPGQASGV